MAIRPRTRLVDTERWLRGRRGCERCVCHPRHPPLPCPLSPCHPPHTHTGGAGVTTLVGRASGVGEAGPCGVWWGGSMCSAAGGGVTGVVVSCGFLAGSARLIQAPTRCRDGSGGNAGGQAGTRAHLSLSSLCVAISGGASSGWNPWRAHSRCLASFRIGAGEKISRRSSTWHVPCRRSSCITGPRRRQGEP